MPRMSVVLWRARFKQAFWPGKESGQHEDAPSQTSLSSSSDARSKNSARNKSIHLFGVWLCYGGAKEMEEKVKRDFEQIPLLCSYRKQISSPIPQDFNLTLQSANRRWYVSLVAI